MWNYFSDNLHAPDVKGVIVDVRGNGGGYANDLSLLWGQMFSKSEHQIGWSKMKIGDGRLDYAPLVPFNIFKDPNKGRDVTVPIVLLINRYSISCSELSALFARSLPNGYLVGGTTFGGQGPIASSHVVFNAGSFSAPMIKITQTPFMQTLDLKKQSFEGKGIPPDDFVPFEFGKLEKGEDTRLATAIEVIIRERQSR
jgi:C-terminal processing protease CtpA/Prc